jgi:hypothetical protein
VLTVEKLKNEGDFQPISVYFENESLSDIFSSKNNKTLNETLQHRRYKNLEGKIYNKYKEYLQLPLGEFLLKCKNNSDNIYKLFLNKYGDLNYCIFKIEDKNYLNTKGIYAFSLEENVVYIGRCKDSIIKRVNQGYGKIYPKNCYKDGQATNCHINSLINNYKDTIKLWLWKIDDIDMIVNQEIDLINKYKPKWNIQVT